MVTTNGVRLVNALVLASSSTVIVRGRVGRIEGDPTIMCFLAAGGDGKWGGGGNVVGS